MVDKVILIDMDGVLNLYNGKYDPDYVPPKASYADRFLSELSKDFKLILFSTRNPKLTKTWLEENELDKYFIDITNVKKPAYLIIDDRCITFNGDVDDILAQIKDFAPWFKKKR